MKVQPTTKQLIEMLYERLPELFERQPAQEPVAWITPTGHIHFDPYLGSIPLYTAPPQRTWVGLTDEVQTALWDASRAALPRFHTYATLIEKELRILNT